MSTEPDVSIHKAVVHSINADTGICHVKIPAVTGQKIVAVSTEGLTENSQGIWNVPRVGDLVLVALTRATSPYVSWVTGMYADLYRGDVNGVIEAINGWDIGDLQINQPGALSTNLIISRHILAGSIITEKLATNAIKSVNYTPTVASGSAGTMASGGAVLLDASPAQFNSQMKGDTIVVNGAGVGGTNLTTTIAGYTDTSHITLTAPAMTAVSGASWTITRRNNWSFKGSFLDLAQGNMSTPGMSVDGITGDMKVRGRLEASTFALYSGTVPIATLAAIPPAGETAPPGMQTILSTTLTGAEGALVLSGLTGNGATEMSWGSGGSTPTYAVLTQNNYAPGYTGSSYKAQYYQVSASYLSATSMTNDNLLSGGGYTEISGQVNSTGLNQALLTARGDPAYYAQVLVNSPTGANSQIAMLAMYPNSSTQSRLLVNPSSLVYEVNSVNRVTVDNAKLTVDGVNSPSITLGDWSINGAYTALEGTRGYIIMGHASDATMYVRGASGSALNIGANNADQMTFNASVITATNSIAVTGYVSATTNLQATNYVIGRAASGSNYYECGLQSGLNSTNGCLSLWALNVAPQLRVGANVDTIYVRNSNDTADATLNGILVNTSSRHMKQDISPLSIDSVALAQQLGALAVSYRYRKENYLQRALPPRRHQALERLNGMRANKGLDPFETDETLHVCGKGDCNGTAANPCEIHRDWEEGSVGFISQDVAEILPQAARLSPWTGEYEGLDSLALVAVAMSAISKLVDRIEKLESKRK